MLLCMRIMASARRLLPGVGSAAQSDQPERAVCWWAPGQLGWRSWTPVPPPPPGSGCCCHSLLHCLLGCQTALLLCLLCCCCLLPDPAECRQHEQAPGVGWQGGAGWPGGTWTAGLACFQACKCTHKLLELVCARRANQWWLCTSERNTSKGCA